MSQYQYGETLTISTDNIGFSGDMPDEPTLGESYYINTYIQMVAPGSKSQYVDGTLQLNWGEYTPESEESDPTDGRRAFYLTTVPGYNDKYFCTSDGLYADFEVGGQPVQGTPWCTFNLHWSFGTDVDQHTVGNGSTSYPITEVFFESNLPIFETQAEAQQYIDDGSNFEDAINYTGEKILDTTTKDYYIYARYQSARVNRGIVSTTSSIVHQANERILYNGRDICLFRNSSNPFSFSIKYGRGLLGSLYSATDINYIMNADASEFVLDSLEYTGPFYSTYNSRFGISNYEGYLGQFDTNLPLWDNEEDADLYLSGELDITDAPNWNKISQDKVWSNILTNLTGLPEESTVFGDVYTRPFFSQMYLCNTSALQVISNSLFDYDVTTLTGLWDDIKKGLEMYGTNPIEVVQGLRFYPFDLSEIFSSVSSQQYIYFGAYKLDMPNNNVLKVIYANGYKDLGTVHLSRTFKDWRDFEPYTKLSIYLPYVGRFSLDLKKYYDKDINIRYYFDIRTGACAACLIANGILLDWFDGIIGTEMPITLTDYSSYAQNQLNIIMRNSAGGAVGIHHTGNEANAIGKYAIQADNRYLAEHPAAADYSKKMGGISAGQAAAGAAQVGSLAVGAAVIGAVAMKTAFDLQKDGTAGYTKSRPASSAMINQFLPQYPTFMFEIQEIDESPYLNELYGRPSNASGSLGDFSGYLEAEDVMLICPIATDNERQEIIDLVKSGIYI